MGVRSLFEHGARLWPDRVCLDDGRERLTYAETEARTARLASALVAGGIGAGAKCALLSPNCAAAMVALLTIYRADRVFVPLNASFPIAEHQAAVDGLGVSVLFFHRRFAAAAAGMLERCGSLQLAVCIDADAGVGISAAALAAAHPAALLPPGTGHPDDVTAIYPTGGSTGAPKRVMHTRRTWTTMAACFHTALPAAGAPVYLLSPPLTHAAGAFGIMLMAVGATLAIQDGFDAGAILQAVERERVTHLYLPPTAIYKLLDHLDLARRDCSSLQAFMYTAAPMSLDKLRDCLAAFGPVMVQFWGQMEAPSFCTCLRPEDHVVDDPALAARLASCGRETMFARVEVMDDDGSILTAGERGELVVRSDLVMAGYYGNPAATAETQRDGWHLTGDLGFKDVDGYVYIVGRKRDMIITGGYNVYPIDIEQTLWAHPDVEECAVIGVPDPLWGEAVMAVVQPRRGRVVDEAALIAFCKERLGSIKAPKRIEVRADIPRNAIGKVDKVSLREPFWRDQPRRV